VPFLSDLSHAKLRPAVVLSAVGRGDYILRPATSAAYSDARAVPLTDQDFVEGGLRLRSFVRPGKLFTANEQLITREVGVLTDVKREEVVRALTALINENRA
jgi:mRNA interferase MazF